MSDLEPHAARRLVLFEAERRRGFAIAYRMLGSVHEAEDILQEAWLRWDTVDPDSVANPAAFLVSVVTRLCLDHLKTAHQRRIEYVGPWLPEPLVEQESAMSDVGRSDLEDLASDVSIAFLLMLERLAPVERAVFLLRESFGFDYSEIAPIVGKTVEHCRQIDRRARQRLAQGPRFAPANAVTHDRLVARFLRATRDGDLDGLLGLLAADVVAYSDGGGKATAARRPIIGAARVARFITGIRSKATPDVSLRLGRVNGRLGLLTYWGDRLFSVLTLYAEADRIKRIFIVLNPEKLPDQVERPKEPEPR